MEINGKAIEKINAGKKENSWEQQTENNKQERLEKERKMKENNKRQRKGGREVMKELRK